MQSARILGPLAAAGTPTKYQPTFSLSPAPPLTSALLFCPPCIVFLAFHQSCEDLKGLPDPGKSARPPTKRTWAMLADNNNTDDDGGDDDDSDGDDNSSA